MKVRFVAYMGFALCASVLTAEEAAPPCDPKPVKKPVVSVRREIKVSIIGADRPQGPEGVLSYRGYGPDKKRIVVQKCGDGLLKLFQAYAKEHACYLSFNAYRQRPDGKFSNTSFFIDREGDVIAVYDKVYPTPAPRVWRRAGCFPPGSRPSATSIP